MPPTSSPKPHKTYEELVSLLKSRGMIIPDEERARRKFAQIGYYRLSVFWYPCRAAKEKLTSMDIILRIHFQAFLRVLKQR